MTIDLPPELEDAVKAAAREHGTTAEAFVLATLRKHLLPVVRRVDPDCGAQNLAEYLEGYIGILDSRDFVVGGAQLSENTGEQFTDILVEKRRQGRL
ncbi:hypothetical protein [Longimicrobium sp.]|jgi:hypothetical protein|uniref:hypothetical protein n=1 Tax=Longimicrobium sp. TaxID=2029185 RepID=UPI002ED8844E